MENARDPSLERRTPYLKQRPIDINLQKFHPALRWQPIDDVAYHCATPIKRAHTPEVVAERIRTAIAAANLPDVGRVTVSIGVALADPAMAGYHTLSTITTHTTL